MSQAVFYFLTGWGLTMHLSALLRAFRRRITAERFGLLIVAGQTIYVPAFLVQGDYVWATVMATLLVPQILLWRWHRHHEAEHGPVFMTPLRHRNPEDA